MTNRAHRRSARDALWKPGGRHAVAKRWYHFNLARAYTWAGEPDAALKQIEIFLGLPSAYKVNNFRLDPVWDPIRKDPRFEQLLGNKKP